MKIVKETIVFDTGLTITAEEVLIQKLPTATNCAPLADTFHSLLRIGDAKIPMGNRFDARNILHEIARGVIEL